MEFPGQAGKKSQDTNLLSSWCPFKRNCLGEKLVGWALFSMPTLERGDPSSRHPHPRAGTQVGVWGGLGTERGSPKVSSSPLLTPPPPVVLSAQRTRPNCAVIISIVAPWYPRGLGSRIPQRYPNLRMLRSLYTMSEYRRPSVSTDATAADD